MIWIVGLGGILGAVCRYSLSVWLLNKSKVFPLATWIANLTGSFFLGCIFGLYTGNALSEIMWLFIGIGFLGSYTTMSTFGFEVIQLLDARKIKQAVLYTSSSVVLGICSAWAGHLVTSIF